MLGQLGRSLVKSVGADAGNRIRLDIATIPLLEAQSTPARASAKIGKDGRGSTSA
jgi:hypothetical protein